MSPSILCNSSDELVVSDLYRMGWNAPLGTGDFEGERANPEYLDLSREQEHAFATGGHSADVKAEPAKVAEADFVLLHFPIGWFSMPAALKGWIDPVFSRGFAYSAGRKYDAGHFDGKRAMLCVTTGTGRPMSRAASMATCTMSSGRSTMASWRTQALPLFRPSRPGCRLASRQRNGRPILPPMTN